MARVAVVEDDMNTIVRLCGAEVNDFAEIQAVVLSKFIDKLTVCFPAFVESLPTTNNKISNGP